MSTLANENQLYTELTGLACNLLPWMGGVSASRLIMWGSQLPQALVIEGCTRDRFYTGVGREYGKYTWKTKIKDPMDIIEKIEKFNVGQGLGAFTSNPRTTYVVYNRKKDEYDIVHVDKYVSHHNNFGYEQKLNLKALEQAHRGGAFRAGDVLAQSPSIDEYGIWRPGLLTTTATLSHPYTTEDGFVVMDEWCERAKSRGFGTIAINVPKDHYLLNVNGTLERQKLIPEPGDKIREDGLLLAMRKHDDILGGVELSPKEMMELDYFFDEFVYIEAHTRNARVIDVEVWKPENDPLEQQPTPEEQGMTPSDDVTRFDNARRQYHKRILDAYDKIIRDNRKAGKTPKFSKKFSRLIRDSAGATSEMPGLGRLKLLPNYNGQQLNTCRIVIKYTYDVVPTIGFKATGCWGDKGVICKVLPRERMPMDQYGVVAEVLSAPVVSINRMNPPKVFEQYYNFQCMRMEERVREYIKRDSSDESYREVYKLLLSFYEVISKPYYDKLIEFNGMGMDIRRVRRHVDSIVNGTMYIYLPSHTQNIGVEGVGDIEDRFPSDYGSVTFYNEKGELRRTRNKVRIGANYMIVLEKTGHDWSAVDAPRRQVHGVPAKMSQKDRHSLPWRYQAIRLMGEAEVRNQAGILGGEYMADQVDRPNNPKALYQIFSNIMHTDRPTDIERVVDRDEIPVGNSLALSYLNNTMYCAGAQFAYFDVDRLGIPPDVAIPGATAVPVDPEEEVEEEEEDDSNADDTVVDPEEEADEDSDSDEDSDDDYSDEEE